MKIGVVSIVAVLLALSLVNPVYAASKKSKKKDSNTSTTVTLNRGKGLRITVPSPNTSGLSDADSWTAQVIQDLMTTGFSTYTDMTVIDRSNEALVIEEQKRSEKGTYSDSDYLEMGKITQAQYLLVGKLTNAGGVYRLALNINDGTTNEIKASFNESVSLNDIQNGNATNQALLKLIPAMNLELTSEEINRLNTKAATAKSNDERTVSTVNLAKGMAAEANKNTVEALAYYASSQTKEAAMRYDKISVAFATGNIREDVKNDIAARNEWIKIYKDLQNYVNRNAIKISYDVTPGEYEVDYRRNTVTIPFTYSYEVNQTMLDVYRQIERGLRATGKKGKWETGEDFSISAPYYEITFELRNDSGKVIATAKDSFSRNISDALYKLQRNIEDEARNQETTTYKRGFVRSGVSGGSSNSNNSYKISFENIPYTSITDSISMGIAKIEVKQSSWGKTLVVNPPIDITVLGENRGGVASSTYRVIEAGEPEEWGKYNKGDTGPAGGFIVKTEKKGWIIDGKEYHYLEVSPYVVTFNDDVNKKIMSVISYSGHTVKKIGNTKISQKLGDGLKNTNILLSKAAENGWSDIISLVSGYSYGGFNDWYIPTDDDIDAVGYWLDWSGTSKVSGRDWLCYLFTWEGAISLRDGAYSNSQYTSLNMADFKGYFDPPKSDCILFVRSF